MDKEKLTMDIAEKLMKLASDLNDLAGSLQAMRIEEAEDQKADKAAAPEANLRLHRKPNPPLYRNLYPRSLWKRSEASWQTRAVQDSQLRSGRSSKSTEPQDSVRSSLKTMRQ